MSADLYIHVGLRKTGTTWLQEHVFPNLKGVHFIGKSSNNYPEWMIDWAHLDDREFLRNTVNIKKRIEQQSAKDRPNLISSESLTNFYNIYRNAHRISDLFPDAKILITLREPVAVLLSHYNLYVRQAGFFLPINEYLEYGRRPRDIVYRKPIYVADFFYDEIISYFKNLFGNANVYVITFENMIRGSTALKNELPSVFGFDPRILDDLTNLVENKSKPENLIESLRVQNANSVINTVIEKDQSSKITIRQGISFPTDARAKFTEAIKGKCYGYY